MYVFCFDVFIQLSSAFIKLSMIARHSNQGRNIICPIRSGEASETKAIFMVHISFWSKNTNNGDDVDDPLLAEKWCYASVVKHIRFGE